MDADELAVMIGALLNGVNVKYKFLASGARVDSAGEIIWDTVVVDAYDPFRREFTRLDSIEGAQKFILQLPPQ